jgi:P-type conjugative transfer protein TrbJ
MKKTYSNTAKQKKSGQLTIGTVATGISIVRYFLRKKQGGFKKKVKWSILMIAILLLLPLRPAAAFYTVFDPTALIQEILGYIDQISQTVNTARQIENQLSSLANEAKNLANMDSRTAWQTLSGIRSNLTQVMQMQANIRGLTMEYQKVEAAWDTLYRDFGSFNGMSGTDYAAQAQKVLDQTNRATYDAMRAQGLVSQLGNDARNLESLLNASNTSSGALSAAQAGNAIAAVNTQQLMRLQQIVATSYRVESSYHAQQANLEAMSRASSDKFFKSTIDRNPLEGSGKGRGTKHY